MRSSIICLSVVLVAVSFAVTAAQFGGGSVSMTEITNFGSNPANIKMFLYKPKNLPAGSTKVPMILAIHYCGANAQSGESWYKLAPKADQYNFYIVYPQSTHASNCWEAATEATLKHGGGGDGGSMASMVEYMIKTYSVDPTRVYVTGFSSGASMTSSIAAVYPNLFEAGAPVAGLPPGCIDTAVNKGATMTCWGGATTKTPAEWGAAARKAYPEFKGRYPRMLLWHGVKDELLAYSQFLEEVKLWQNLHNLSTTPALTNSNTGVSGFTLTQYGSADAHPLFATMISQTATHAIQYNADIMIKFFGLDGSYIPSPSTPAVNACATENGGCSADATCTPPSGAATERTCKCKAGFTGNGIECTAVAVNVCATSNGGCARDATCTVVNNAASCQCKSGFTGDGKTCTAQPAGNACATNNGGCDEENGVCTLRQGVVSCSCRNGFTKQGNKCVANDGGNDAGASTGGNTKKDLCATSHGGCSEFASCTATATRVTCRCDDGYEGDGKECTKKDDGEDGGDDGEGEKNPTGEPAPFVNYCRTNNGGCSEDAKCRNGASASAVKCTCNEGFSGNGRTCLPIDGALTSDKASASKTPIIIGAVAAGVVVLGIVGYLLYRRSNTTRFNKDVNMVSTTGGSPYQTPYPQETQPYPPQAYAPPTQGPPPPMMPYPPQPRY